MSDQDKDFIKFLYEEDLYLIKGDEPAVENEPLTEQKEEVEIEASSEAIEEVDAAQSTEEKSEAVAKPAEETGAVETANEPSSPYPPKTSDLLIIFENTNAPEMHPNDREFLSKILAAVKIELKDCDMQNVDQIMPKADGYAKVICFTAENGIEGAPSKYAVGNAADGAVLVADELSAIAAAVPLKKQLWAALQGMFGV